MAIDQKDMTEVESQRHDAIAEIEAVDGPAWTDGYEPGTFGCHELLDRVHRISSLFQERVLEHPACLQNPEWYQLANSAVETIEKLYREISATHLSDDAAE